MLVSSNDDRTVILLAVTWVFCGLGITFVILRLYSHATIVKQFFWDDLWIVLSLICDIGMCIVRTLYAASGYARHASYLSTDGIVDAERLSWISIGMSIASPSLGRLSVACLIYRIASHQKWSSRVLKSFMVMIALTFTGAILLTYLQCTPPGALFDSNLRQSGQAACMKPITYIHSIIGFAAFWCFCDIALAAMTICMFWNLHDTLRKKILLVSLLSLGVFAGVCVAVKIWYCILLTSTTDFTWLNAAVFFWDIIETNIIIIAASIATLGPFVLKTFCREDSPPALHQHEGRLSSFGSIFGFPKSKRLTDSDPELEIHDLGPILAPDSLHTLSHENGQPLMNGVSTAYSSGDLPALTEAAIEVQHQLALDSAEQDKTRRFEEEGYK